MKRFGFLAALMWVAAVQAAPVYECVDARGNRTYGERSGPNCKAADFRGVGFSSAPAYQGGNAPDIEAQAAGEQTGEGAAAGSGNPERETQLANARRAVQTAKRNLEEGRKVRLGNERNYARYLERIAGLEKAVADSEAQLRALEAQP